MVKLRSILKEINQSKFQIIIFMFCIILSIGTFISIDSLRLNVEDFVEKDSKAITGGDIIIDSRKPFSQNLSLVIQDIKNNYSNLEFVNSYSFTSVVFSSEKNSSLLSQIRVVSNSYPLYGEVELEGGESISEVLIDGQIVVELDLLKRLELEVGDDLKIGDKTFSIAGVLLHEPDNPLDLFQLGPRILVPEVNLEELNLIGDKSRVSYEVLIKTQDDEQSRELIGLVNSSLGEREDVTFYFDKNNSLKSFVLNFLFFIKMISLFIIIISGIGMTSIILSYLDEKKISVGIRKSLGERDNSILFYYYKTIIFVSIIATLLSLIFAYGLIKIFPFVFEEILPKDIVISLSLFAILKGVIVSFIITTLFTLYPLVLLKKIHPIEIFRKQETKLFRKSKSFYFIYMLIVVFFTVFVFVEIEDFWISFWLVLGSILLFLFLFFLTTMLLSLIKKYKYLVSNLELRQSLNGLFRIGNKTVLVITSIALSLCLIFTISFIETNLQDQFINSFPPNSPNFVVLDIPKENLTQIREIIGEGEIIFYPVIQGSLVSLNGEAIEIIEERAPSGDSLTRTFSLTYGDLLESEKIVETSNPNEIFLDSWDREDVVQVSVLDEIGDRMDAELGDRLVFLIQGVEIEAEVVSIRTRVAQDISAFFYFTFEEEVLIDAPQTIFTFSRVNSSKIPTIQNEIVRNFPQVTVINTESTAKTIGDIINELSSIISFFTFFSLGAGILILLSSIVSTNSQRTQEAVFYKLVGVNKSFIRKVFLFEYLIIGLISSVIAILFSSIATYLITKFVLDIDFIFLTYEILFYLFTTVFVIVFIGYLSSLNVFRKKPIEYMRENKVE